MFDMVLFFCNLNMLINTEYQYKSNSVTEGNVLFINMDHKHGSYSIFHALTMTQPAKRCLQDVLITAWQDNQDILLGHLKDILKITFLQI